MNYLPKLNYPIRVGTHTNTAFGLTFAYDYAIAADHKELKELIEKRAKDYFLNDKGCPIGWEPSGQDFLSPPSQSWATLSSAAPVGLSWHRWGDPRAHVGEKGSNTAGPL